MGMSLEVEFMLGYELSEEELEKIQDEYNKDDDWDALEQFCEKYGIEFSYGVMIDWGLTFIVGLSFEDGPSGFGVHEMPDDFGEVDYTIYEKVRPLIERFGREPRKFLVTNYG